MIRQAWVVGSSGGIGSAVMEALDDSGVYVLGTPDGVDVRNYNSIRRFLTNNPIAIDSLVYCAGINKLDWSSVIDPVEMNNIYDVNVTGLVRVLQACDEAELDIKRVVVVSSDAAVRPMRTSLAYCASKAALDMAVKILARELASDDFAINIVSPGITHPTGMSKYVDDRVVDIRGWTIEQAQEYERSGIPLGRRASPSEIAEVIVKVLHMETTYMNGAVIPVNGGR